MYVCVYVCHGGVVNLTTDNLQVSINQRNSRTTAVGTFKNVCLFSCVSVFTRYVIHIYIHTHMYIEYYETSMIYGEC